MYIDIEQNSVTIQMEFDKNSLYQIYIVDLKSNQKKILKEETVANIGNYYERFDLSPGIYVVVCVINGVVETQKIIIK